MTDKDNDLLVTTFFNLVREPLKNTVEGAIQGFFISSLAAYMTAFRSSGTSDSFKFIAMLYLGGTSFGAACGFIKSTVIPYFKTPKHAKP